MNTKTMMGTVVAVALMVPAPAMGAAVQDETLTAIVDYPVYCDWDKSPGGALTDGRIQITPRHCATIHRSIDPAETQWQSKRIRARAASWLILLHEYAHTLGYGHGPWSGEPDAPIHATCAAARMMPDYIGQVPAEHQPALLRAASVSARSSCDMGGRPQP